MIQTERVKKSFYIAVRADWDRDASEKKKNIRANEFAVALMTERRSVGRVQASIYSPLD